MVSPIRVGLIGLSSAPATWAFYAHIPYLIKSPHYIVVALCNSSIESAQAAIKTHGLPSTTKAYASSKELAQDQDVDLVVVSVNVSTHYDLAKPALLAGKDTFVEWPLASNLAQAEELVAIAESTGAKLIIGLQETLAPAVLQVKEIVTSGRLGKVLSTSILVDGLLVGHSPWAERIAYFGDKSVGGNLLTINAMHILDALFSVVGELESYTPLLGNLRPSFPVIKDDGSIGHITKNTPDQILINGRLESGAMLSFHMRGGPPFKDAPALLWRIYGEKGEIKLEGDAFALFNGTPVTLKLHVFETDEVETIDAKITVTGWEDRPGPSQAIGSVYEAFATGKSYPDGHLALKRHQMIDDIYERNP